MRLPGSALAQCGHFTQHAAPLAATFIPLIPSVLVFLVEALLCCFVTRHNERQPQGELDSFAQVRCAQCAIASSRRLGGGVIDVDCGVAEAAAALPIPSQRTGAA